MHVGTMETISTLQMKRDTEIINDRYICLKTERTSTSLSECQLYCKATSSYKSTGVTQTLHGCISTDREFLRSQAFLFLLNFHHGLCIIIDMFKQVLLYSYDRCILRTVIKFYSYERSCMPIIEAFVAARVIFLIVENAEFEAKKVQIGVRQIFHSEISSELPVATHEGALLRRWRSMVARIFPPLFKLKTQSSTQFPPFSIVLWTMAKTPVSTCQCIIRSLERLFLGQ